MLKKLILFLITHCLVISINNTYVNYELLDINECNAIPENLFNVVKKENIFFDKNKSKYTIDQITLMRSEKNYLFLSVYNSKGFNIIKLPLHGKEIYETNLNIEFFHKNIKQDIPDAKVYLIEEKEKIYLLIESILQNGQVIDMNWILDNENLYTESFYTIYCFKKLVNKSKYENEFLEKLPKNEWIKLNSKIFNSVYDDPIILPKKVQN